MSEKPVCDERSAARDHARRVATMVDTRLRPHLVVPDGHAYLFGVDYEISRWQGGPGHSVSAYVRPTAPYKKVPAQLHAEFRVFLDAPRAQVWISLGPRFFDQHTPLLQGETLYAADYEALAEEILTRVNPILAAEPPRLPIRDQGNDDAQLENPE